MKIIDLTHTFTKTMPAYPGDPLSSLKQVADISKEGYTDHQINTVMHVGTHMDAPLHMIKNGKSVDEIAAAKLIGPGVLIDARNVEKVDTSLLKQSKIPKGSIVLVYTGFGGKYRTKKYYKNYPYVTADFAKKMIEQKVKIVGMDMLGPDLDAPWTAHKILLGHEVLILENLVNLDQLQNAGKFQVIALPAKLKADAAPARVIAIIQD